MRSKALLCWGLISGIFFAPDMPVAFAQYQEKVSTGKNAQAPVEATMEEVVVKGNSGEDTGFFLPAVSGTKINAGKKTFAVSLKEAPPVANNNFRQALSKATGVLISEETTPLFSVSYRGLEPHRAQYIQVMKDGVPIHADMIGYPEAYYVPPTQSVSEIEFIKGGAGLMYGPQPGGALNFVTHQPALDTPFRVTSENIFGTDNYFSTYEAITGTTGPLGYTAYFHERQGDGFRRRNSDYEVISSGVKAVINQTGDSRLTMSYDEYHEEHGEPGGLTRAQFDADPAFTTRALDRFKLERYYGNIRYEKEFSEMTQADFLVYGGHYRRYSKRQNGGAFGTVPRTPSNSIEEQDFYNLGIEPRLRHNYELFGEEHTVSIGTHAFFSNAPREDQTGANAGANSGRLIRSTDRDTQYFSVFMENLFRMGNFSITPGVRLEHIWQDIEEEVNLQRSPLRQDSFDFAPLFGIGAAYQLPANTEIYTNLSQSYRPKVFTQAIPTGATQIINEDLKESEGLQYDFGIRGKPFPFLAWDIDYFLLSFSNQIAAEANTLVNGGRSRHHGMEFFTEADVIGALDYFRGTQHGEKWGKLAPFISMTLLDAEFSAGRFSGRQPQYAPQYNLRVGTQYSWKDRFKLNLLSTFVDEHFADDASTAAFYIPSYKVWDLTGEVNLLKNVKDTFDVSVFGGINNLFNEKYYSRVRADGIDPAYERNIYGGVKVTWG